MRGVTALWTSDEIVAATAVSRYRLYDIYENKRGLFLATLEHYYATVFQALLAPVDKPASTQAEIRQYI